ncbi:DEAD/DEAH box helicase [Halofilum ochraceum]|uniref:DEAD/DEAH box helicase n=1 Tax=Halofilum ochraceum TaxID=1611323 RepID=UPI0008D9DD17|nr:DEAD/DEAH box helicase [Halofilum ochraceum]
MTSAESSRAFEALHPHVQRWIWRQGWGALTPTQERAIPTLVAGDQDVIVAAATAGGKTEAAFLPVLSRLLGDEPGHYECEGLALYISPLKALINDQFQRLELMVEGTDIPVVPWHGDVGRKQKDRFFRKRQGVLLITPESLEALFVTHGHRVPQLFERLRYLIVDELHAFIGVERGMQLQSLMHRLELTLRRRVPRVGLSATLGDMGLAAEFLRPGGGEQVDTIVSTEDSGAALKLQVRGYEHKPPALSTNEAEERDERGEQVDQADTLNGDVVDIARHLFRTLRGTNNLIFANSRRDVEVYGDLLRRECDSLGVPVEFFPHHGSLSKDLREHVETSLKTGTQPVTAVCTSTLEMGIDIGAVASIAQIGPPHQVASLRQRLGRSGRRGDAAVLRLYIREDRIDDQTPPPDRLRPALFQAAAMTELLLERWTEPPRVSALHLSTLIQQILSVVAQYGGATAQGLWNVLCESAPFSAVSQDHFLALLRQMGAARLLMQSRDGTLLHGEHGERIVNHYSFYSAFNAPEEFSLAVDGKIIGTLPIDRPVMEESYLIFSGRRWRVLHVDTDHKRIDLARATGGRAPSFGGTPGTVHDKVRDKMFELYRGAADPVYLDTQAKELFTEGREHFQRLGLRDECLVEDGKNTLVFPWAGDIAMDTLAAILTSKATHSEREGICVRVKDAQPSEVRAKLRDICDAPAPSPEDLASGVQNKQTEKYDEYLGEDLLNVDWSSRRLDTQAAIRVAGRLTRSGQ